MSETEYLEVTVKEATHDDAGRGIARLSIDVMKKLGLISGDVIEIVGKKVSAALVWPGFAQDTGNAILRIDGNIRENVSTSIDEKVKIRKSAAEYAQKIVIQPTTSIRLIGGDEYLARVLRGRSVIEGQVIRVDVIGNSITLVITKVVPKGIAIVTDETDIELKEEAYNIEKGKEESLNIHYEDIGGLNREIQIVRENIELPIRHPEIFEHLGIRPPVGVMLHGPPGIGKTLIAKAVANETGAYFISLSAGRLVSEYQKNNNFLYEKLEEAIENSPSIIFIDNIDQIADISIIKTFQTERHIVSQIIDLFDQGWHGKPVILIAATTDAKSLDPGLLRSGRFDIPIALSYPDKEGRAQILQIHTRSVHLADDVNIGEIMNNTDGFSGADIKNLIQKAGISAIKRGISTSFQKDSTAEELLGQISINQKDLISGIEFVKSKNR